MNQLPRFRAGLCRSRLLHLHFPEANRTLAVRPSVNESTRPALLEAATVTIRLDDPLHLLRSTAKSSPPLATGAKDQGDNFHAASQVAADVSGRSYQLGVPYDKPMHLWVQTWKYQLTDATGSALNSSGTAIPFQIVTNTTPPIFTIRLTGILR
jgi:hypothetical protein